MRCLFPRLRFVKLTPYNWIARGFGLGPKGRSRGTPGSMRALVITVTSLILAVWLDNSLAGGFYTQAMSRMLSDIAVYFR